MDALTPIRETLLEPERLSWLSALLESETCTSRRQVALALCEQFDFQDAGGLPRISSCSAALVKLEASGKISLPVSPTGSGARGHPKRLEEAVPSPVEVPDRVDRIVGLHVSRVCDDHQHRIFNELMAREHPMGSVFQAGAQMRYLIGSEHGWLGGLGFSASAYLVKARDQWIGWETGHPPRHLVTNLSRFLIRPEVHCQNLASWALAQTVGRLGEDFMRHYGYRPVLVETFVHAQQHTGHSLLAAGWTKVGETAGRGRFSPAGQGVPKRAIWCRPLSADWRAALGVCPPEVVKRDVAAGLDRWSWSEQEFGGAPLGDKRLSKRLVKSAHMMAESPMDSFPAAAKGDAASVAGFYRMIEHPAESEVSVENILAVHRERTIERIANQSSVLLIQDGTDLNFATHGACEGLGLIGKNQSSEGSLGLHLHSTLAVSTSGVPLGVMHLEFDAPKSPKEPSGEDAKSKTQRWIRGVQDSAQAAQRVPDVSCIAVMDREGDAYEIFQQCRQLEHVDLLVRARHNRVLGAQGARLFDQVRQAPAQARVEIEVMRSSARRSARGQREKAFREARLAECELRWQAVTILANPCSSRSTSVPLNLVHVQETSVPRDGSDPLEWFLLTTLPVEHAEAAEQLLEYYRLRWRIEDWHRILKSGCKAEFLNLQTADRLERAIAIKAVIAWRLHAMVLLGRDTPELPAEVLFSHLEIRMLELVALDRKRPVPSNLGRAVLTMAMLGGYLARKHDPPPGHKVIWTGYIELGAYGRAYELFKRLDPEYLYPNLRPDKTCG